MKQLHYRLLIAFLFLTFSNLMVSHKSFARGNAAILQIAKSQIGVREYRGRGNNPRITRYFRSAIGRNRSDATPWCSAFLNYVAKRAGHRGTNSLAARSWARWGRRTNSPRPGDIVVFSRRGGGHVGVFLGYSGNRVRVIGGNQSNAVSVKTYSRRTVISYRTAGRGSSRASKRRMARAKKKRRYRTTRKTRKAKRRLARRVAANQRRKKRTNKKKIAKRRKLARLKKKRSAKKRVKQQSYYQQPAQAYEAPAPATRYNVDGTIT